MLRSGGQWESRAQPPTDYKSGWNSVPSREIIRQATGTGAGTPKCTHLEP